MLCQRCVIPGKLTKCCCAGVLIVAETTTGCLVAASGIGERGVQAEDVAGKACDELIEVIESGACVDQWYTFC